MSPEMVHDEFEKPSNRADLNNMPTESLPDAPPDADAIVAVGEAHRLGAASEHHSYYRLRIAMNESAAAVERLKRDDLSPQQRTDSQRLAARYASDERECGRALKAHREHLRLLGELRVEEYPSFARWAEGHVPAVAEAAAELAPVLRRYLAAYEEARAAWESIANGTYAFVADRDEELGFSRGADSVAKDVATPDCPISEEAARQILTVMPRPRIFKN